MVAYTGFSTEGMSDQKCPICGNGNLYFQARFDGSGFWTRHSCFEEGCKFTSESAPLNKVHESLS
jgi:hypothetical protein